jgi:hypothetical protein
LLATGANQVWAYDFVYDACANGQQLKRLTAIDQSRVKLWRSILILPGTSAAVPNRIGYRSLSDQHELPIEATPSRP